MKRCGTILFIHRVSVGLAKKTDAVGLDREVFNFCGIFPKFSVIQADRALILFAPPHEVGFLFPAALCENARCNGGGSNDDGRHHEHRHKQDVTFLFAPQLAGIMRSHRQLPGRSGRFLQR